VRRENFEPDRHGRQTRVCRVFIFKDTGVQPHLSVGLSSNQRAPKGRPTRTPPRNPRPRTSRQAFLTPWGIF
jgi:hypothetical protein